MNPKTFNPARDITPTTMYITEYREGLFIAVVPIGGKETTSGIYRGKSDHIKAIMRLKVPTYIILYRYDCGTKSLGMVKPVGVVHNQKTHPPIDGLLTANDYAKRICEKHGIETNKGTEPPMQIAMFE